MGDVKCLSCGKECEDYQELALHISSSKKGHRKGKRWAAKYISRHVIGKKKLEFNGRVPLTEEQKANKEDTKRVLSGDMEYANTICLKCKKHGRPLLEIEYVTSPHALRVQGKLAKLCANCGGER